jgi:hypothetical protein
MYSCHCKKLLQINVVDEEGAWSINKLWEIDMALLSWQRLVAAL